jgi:subtilisin family serine protease
MGDDEDDGVLAEAVARASAGGVVVVAAWGDDPGGVPMFPARHPAVRAVAAPPDLAIPAVGGDGRRRMCRGSSVACVLVAGFLAAARAKGLRL